MKPASLLQSLVLGLGKVCSLHDTVDIFRWTRFMCHGAQTKGLPDAKVLGHVKLLHKGNAMLYRFKSGATSDLIMNGNRGDQLLDIIGKPPAPRGILPVDALADAIRALELAVSAQEAQSRAPNHDNEVTLRQRAWPLVEMLKRAHHEQVTVVWGV